MALLPGILMRTLHTSAAAAAAAPALAVSRSSGGGLASLLGFGHTRNDLPLSEAMPVPHPLKHKGVPTAAPTLQSGTLSAGTKVVAVDTPSPVASVALVHEGGPAYETGSNLGASKVLEAMAFHATANRTTFRLTRELEVLGAVATSNARRDHMLYSISGPKLNTAEVVELLVDAVANARLSPWEVSEVLAHTKASLAVTLRDPSTVISEALHRAAFEGGLGQPLNIDPALVDGITHDALQEFLHTTFNPAKAVIAAAGVGLDELKQLANPLMGGGAAGGGSASLPGSKYVGGNLNVVAPTSPLTYVALGFEAGGGLSDRKAAAAAGVVKALLDPSRSVLPRQHKESDVFRSAVGFSHLYKGTGLVGMVAASAPAQAAQLTDAVTAKVEALAKGVSEGALQQAKQLVISAHKAQVASTSGLVAVAAPILLCTGEYKPADYPAAVEALTAKDVAEFVSKGLKAGPTFVTYGSMSHRVPSYNTITKRLA